MDAKKLSTRFQCKVCLGAKQYRFKGQIVRHDGSTIDCDHVRDCEFCQRTGLDIPAVQEAVARLKSLARPSDQCQECLGHGRHVLTGDGLKPCAACLATGLNDAGIEGLLIYEETYVTRPVSAGEADS